MKSVEHRPLPQAIYALVLYVGSLPECSPPCLHGFLCIRSQRPPTLHFHSTRLIRVPITLCCSSPPICVSHSAFISMRTAALMTCAFTPAGLSVSLGSAWHRATVQYIFSELINTWIKPGLGLLWSLRPHWALFSSKVTISRDNIYFLITPRIKLLFNSCMYMSIPSQNIFKYFLPQCHPLHTHRRWVNECLMNYNQVRNLRWMN